MVHGSPVAAVTRRPNSVMKSRPAFLVGLTDISPTVLKGYFLFLYGYKHANRPLLAIFHCKIITGGLLAETNLSLFLMWTKTNEFPSIELKEDCDLFCRCVDLSNRLVGTTHSVWIRR